MRKLRYGDWICGVGAVALLGALFAGDDGWLPVALAVIAIVAGLATPLLTIVRDSPSAPLLTVVIAFVAGIATAIAMLVGDALLQFAAAAVLTLGAALALHDERSPGAPEIAVERRAVPPARQ